MAPSTRATLFCDAGLSLIWPLTANIEWAAECVRP